MAYHSIVESQRQFFKTNQTVPVNFRITQLQALKSMLSENQQKLTDAIYKDLRRMQNQSYCLEIGGAIVEIDYMIDNLHGWTKPKPVEKTFLTLLDTPIVVKEPLGVVLIIAPWNYPISMIVLPLIPALAAGNTVIIKPSEMAPHSSDVMAEIIAKYFDPTYVTVIKGGVSETTELLKERFDHILYTGSPPVAKIIMAAAAKHLTPVTLELGGKCPVVVEKDADIEITARRIAWGKWMNCGQTCLAPDYVMTTVDLKPKLVAALKQTLFEFYGAEPKTSSDYSRIINERHFDRLKSLLEKTDGNILFKGGEADRKDLFIPPTIIDVERSDLFMQDEIFGPILPILTVSGLDDAIETIRNGEKPLAAYIFTNNANKVKRFYSETSSGGITVNDVVMHFTVDTLPFGGVGNSGMGRYRGKYGFDTFSHEKAILKRQFFGESLIACRYPPFTSDKFNKLKGLTGSRKGVPNLIRCLLPILPALIIGILIGVIMQKHRQLLNANIYSTDAII